MRPHRIWLDLASKVDRHSAQARAARRKRKLFRALLRQLRNKLPELYSGDKHVSLSKEQIEAFREHLRHEVPGHVFKSQNNLFVRGLERGRQELSWDVYIPSPVTFSTRERPSFTRNDMFLFHRFRVIEEAFLTSLERELPDDQDVLHGYLAFSASAFGGLLEHRGLEAWLCNPLHNLVYDKGLAWVELNFDSNDGSSKHRRWFIDPLTLMILCRIHAKLTTKSKEQGFELLETRKQAADLNTCLRKLWGHLGLSKCSKPSSPSEFLRMAAMRIAIYSSPFLADYALGKIRAASISPEAWIRVRTGKAVPVLAKTDDVGKEIRGTFAEISKQGSNASSLGPSLRSEIFDAIHPKEYREARKAFTTTESKKRLRSFIDRSQGKLTMVGWLLCQWALFMMSHRKGRRKRSRIAPSTVRTYLACITKPIDILVGNDNLLEYTELEFYTCYTNVIEN